MIIYKFSEFLCENYEILPYRKWQSDIKGKPTIEWSEEDLKVIEKIKNLFEDPETGFELEFFKDGLIRINPTKYDRAMEPYVCIYKYDVFYLKDRGNMFKYGDGYEGKHSEFKIYRGKLIDVVKPELF